MRVDRGGDAGLAVLDGGKEIDKQPAVVAFGETLALNQVARLQYIGWINESVGGDQGDLKPAPRMGQDLFEYTSDRALACGHATRQADDERLTFPILAQESGGGQRARVGSLDVEFDVANQRQVNFKNVLIGERIVNALESLNAMGVEQNFVVVISKPAPLRARERTVAELGA